MAGLNDIWTALQNGVVAMGELRAQLALSFPPISSPSTAAPSVGAITYNSSQVSAFATVTTSSGGAYKIALLPSS